MRVVCVCTVVHVLAKANKMADSNFDANFAVCGGGGGGKRASCSCCV